MVEPGASNPWLAGDGRRGREYDQRFEALAAQGTAVHGEADLVASLTRGSVLDAGCGTGRVAIELAGRGFDVVGVDLDPSMLEVARAKAPSLRWVQADLAQLALGRTFDAVVLAGNVMIFVNPGTEGAVLTALSAHLRPGGLLVAGFSLGPPRLELSAYDRLAGAAGLVLEHRWATWDRTPYRTGDDYAVSVHVKDAGPVPNVDGPDR